MAKSMCPPIRLMTNFRKRLIIKFRNSKNEYRNNIKIRNIKYSNPGSYVQSQPNISGKIIIIWGFGH